MSRAVSTGLHGLAAAALIATAAAMPSSAAAAAGSTTVALNGPAAKQLRAAGIRVSPTGAARGGQRRIVLPVRAGLAGSTATVLRHRGGILLRGRRGAKLRLSGLDLLLGKRSRLKARLGRRQADLFRVLGGGQRRIDPQRGTVALANLRLKLSHKVARAIAARLLPSLRAAAQRKLVSRWASRPLGRVSARAHGLVAGGGATLPEGGKTPSGPGNVAAAAGCPQPSGPGPAPQEPLPVAARPAGAVEIGAATIEWHVRESFIRYIATGEGTSVSGGAGAAPPAQLPGSSASLSYSFNFPFAAGWHHPGANLADPADDSAAIEFGGAVRFLYSAHEIDLSTANPEIEIAGGDSRAIFAIAESGGAAERQVLVNLDLSRAAKIEAGGDTYTYERVPGAIPAGTAGSVFAGFYAPGTEFGCFTVTYTAS
ncbi:MAG: HtaA domain-containing protein [Solirubrobacterales bacterium]